MRRNVGRIVIFVALLALVTSFFALGVHEQLSFARIAARRAEFADVYAAHRTEVLALYAGVYVAVTALSLPGAAVLTLLGGAMFGIVTGTLVVSFASTIGATLAFVAARFVIGDWVRARFGERLRPVDRGIERDGALYLFTLRLVPIFPFFIINLVMALTPLRVRTFYWVSQVGMLPGTIVYVNAGTELGRLDSARGILSPGLIASFVLVGLFPWLAKRLVEPLRHAIRLRKFPRPKRFDYDVVVLGAGSAGLVSSLVASTVKAKVALVEREKMGGDCLNTGCVPSKALIRSARAAYEARRATELGLRVGPVEVDFAAVMRRVHEVIRIIEPHDSVERYRGLGVDVFRGEGRITSPFTVEVVSPDDPAKTLSARSIVIATGAEPIVPPIDGLATAPYYTSETLWRLEELPRRLVVLGGGPVGAELAQAMRRLGAEVYLVEMSDRLLPRDEPEASDIVRTQFVAEGIAVLLQHRAVAVQSRAGGHLLVCEGPSGRVEVPFDAALVALGRRARTQGFGLESLGIRVADQGVIETDEWLRTTVPNVYVCGDAAGPYQFTHAAAHQAWYATVNALFAPFVAFRADYRVIPRVTFTDPEVARVGLSRAEAEARGLAHEVTRYDLADLDRAVTDHEAQGFVQVLTPRGKDEILGATIVGAHAGEVLSEVVLAMRYRLGLKKLVGTVHAYPTLAESNRFVAGKWARAHAPARALSVLARYFTWRRR